MIVNNFYLRTIIFIKNNFQIIIVASVIIIFIITKIPFINKPFIGIHDWASTDLAIGGASFLKFGFINLKGIPVLDVIPPIDGIFNYYCHWPFGIFYLFALGFKLFGIHEWVVRLTVLLLSTPTIYLMYLIGLKIHSKNCGMLAALLISSFPIFSYYSIIGIYESTNLMLCLLMIYFYIKWIDTKSNKYLYYSLMFFIVGAIIAWQIYTVVPWLFLHSIFSKNRNKNVILFILVPFITLFVQIGYIYTMMNSNVTMDFKNIFLTRISMSLSDNQFSLYQYISLLFYRLMNIIGIIPLIIAIYGFIINKSKNYRKDLLLILFLAGITWLIIMKNHCYIHEFTLLYITPFISISASTGILLFVNRSKIIFKYVFFVIVISVVLLQAVPNTVLYFKSDPYKTKKDIGVNLEKLTEPDSILYTNIENTGSHIIEYYSNRHIIYSVKHELINNKPIYEFKLIKAKKLPDQNEQDKYIYLNEELYLNIKRLL